MTVQEVIENSILLVNGNHEEMSYENIVPCNGKLNEYGNQPCFEFTDEFIAKYGELTTTEYEAPNDEDVPEEVYGKQGKYDWYKVGSGDIVFGVLKD